MGTTIMASVKPSSFIMTSLVGNRGNYPTHTSSHTTTLARSNTTAFSYVGTAGDVSYFWFSAGLAPMLSSFSSIVFSVATFRRVAMTLVGLWAGLTWQRCRAKW